MNKCTFGVIVGNRGFFPNSLVDSGRADILRILNDEGYGAVTVATGDTNSGGVETFDDAKKCANLFASRAGEIDGIIVTLPNFGDERGVLEVIRRSGLRVPILVHAEPDEIEKMSFGGRRDSLCGKISVCNNLSQAGIPFTLTKSHTVKSNSAEFRKDLTQFAAVCRIVRGLKNPRFGAIGARPAAFNTVRYSEKLLEKHGISVETIDLSEIVGRANRLPNNDDVVSRKLDAIRKYINVVGIPDDALTKMAKFGAVVDAWAESLELNGIAIQCWTSLQENYGISSCTLMSMMSNALLPSACEVDVTGLLGMYILQMASGSPSALLDWNNNYGDDPDKCVMFHCGNLPTSVLAEPVMDYNRIIGSTMGEHTCYGTVNGRIKAGRTTFCRVSTSDVDGTINAYVGDGEFTNDSLETFGCFGVLKIDNLQLLLQRICLTGFEHHVAVSMSETTDAIHEALSNYLNWPVYRHK